MAETQGAVRVEHGRDDLSSSLVQAFQMLLEGMPLESDIAAEGGETRRDRWRRELDRGAVPSGAGGGVDPTLFSAEAAISDLEHRIGRLRTHERTTGAAMRRDLSHLDAGIEQLRVLSRETGLLQKDD